MKMKIHGYEDEDSAGLSRPLDIEGLTVAEHRCPVEPYTKRL
jgi:hypothetical protein